MRPAEFLGSSTFRQGLLSLALFVCSITLVFWATYHSTAAELIEQLDGDILSEASELSHQADAKGIEAIREAIELRMHDPVGTNNYYALIDSTGRLLSTNLPITSPRLGWFEVLLHEGEPMGPLLRSHGDWIANGAYLAVGRDRSDVDTLRSVFVRGFVICVGATILLTLIFGVFIASRVLGRIEAINNAAGEIIHGDLTRRVPVRGRNDEFDRLAARLNAMLDRIATLMSQVRQVTDDIAHDLRTPLTHLRQRLFLAKRNARSTADYEEMVDRAIADVDAVIATFGSLLRIAQVEAGARRSAFRAVDLSEIAGSLLETYAPVAEDREQHLSGQIEPGVLAFGDRQLLGQLLANLIENAFHHTPAGSRVVLRVYRNGQDAWVEVIDNGPGIPTAMRGEVFKRFVRLDKSRATPGSGLGLSLVAAVADLHSIEVDLSDAVPGQARPGLRATLRFPPLPVGEERSARRDRTSLSHPA